MAGEIGALSGRRAKLLILTMCKAGIVNIFMGNGTAAEGFPTAVADAGSPVEMSALLFESDLFGDGIGSFTKESGDVLKGTSLPQRILDISYLMSQIFRNQGVKVQDDTKQIEEVVA